MSFIHSAVNVATLAGDGRGKTWPWLLVSLFPTLGRANPGASSVCASKLPLHVREDANR